MTNAAYDTLKRKARRSRRELLAGTAGVLGVLGVEALGCATPARANDGDAALLGQANSESHGMGITCSATSTALQIQGAGQGLVVNGGSGYRAIVAGGTGGAAGVAGFSDSGAAVDGRSTSGTGSTA